MKKNRILGFFNIALSFFFLFLFIASGKTTLSAFNHLSLSTLGQMIIFLTAFLMNGILAYFLVIKKIKIKSFRLFLILTFSPLLWLLLIFFGYFFALYLSYFFLIVTLCVIIFLLLYKVSQRIALTLSLVTFLIAIFGIASGFEENYCVAKGQQAEKHNSPTVTVTQQDADALKDFDIKPRQQITISFKTHMLCHTTFNLYQAVEETYFSK